jgi:enamine deaminase RidA (YjgF/YER057c/UK114 family)
MGLTKPLAVSRAAARAEEETMAVDLEIRTVESSVGAEIYISAVPKQNASQEEQAAEVFAAIRDALSSRQARIIEERVFTSGVAVETVLSARSGAYGQLDDGVAPSVLVGREGTIGPIAGVHVHAVAGDVKVEVIESGGIPIGRVLAASGHKLISLSGLSGRHSGRAVEDAQACLEEAESALRQFGADFLSVSRTWMWLGDILSWYDDFNKVRNSFFAERGLIGQGSRQSMPASTGIGLGPAGGGNFAMDLIAVLEPSDSTEYLQAVGRQQCALEYGSAFSRAARAITPAGRTVFVSGTASIDASGASTNLGDAAGQIKATIDNVRAVLRDTGCEDNDVVQAVVYSKTTDIEQVFRAVKGDLQWPWVMSICDICRPELLFEIESDS